MESRQPSVVRRCWRWWWTKEELT